eukprot:m.93581 g.93581  ORF g.93581 m.93581 type:complete len:1123 (+) comp13402_c0_seq3:137-3505(+)
MEPCREAIKKRKIRDACKLFPSLAANEKLEIFPELLPSLTSNAYKSDILKGFLSLPEAERLTYLPKILETSCDEATLRPLMSWPRDNCRSKALQTLFDLMLHDGHDKAHKFLSEEFPKLSPSERIPLYPNITEHLAKFYANRAASYLIKSLFEKIPQNEWTEYRPKILSVFSKFFDPECHTDVREAACKIVPALEPDERTICRPGIAKCLVAFDSVRNNAVCKTAAKSLPSLTSQDRAELWESFEKVLKEGPDDVKLLACAQLKTIPYVEWKGRITNTYVDTILAYPWGANMEHYYDAFENIDLNCFPYDRFPKILNFYLSILKSEFQPDKMMAAISWHARIFKFLLNIQPKHVQAHFNLLKVHLKNGYASYNSLRRLAWELLKTGTPDTRADLIRVYDSFLDATQPEIVRCDASDAMKFLTEKEVSSEAVQRGLNMCAHDQSASVRMKFFEVLEKVPSKSLSAMLLEPLKEGLLSTTSSIRLAASRCLERYPENLRKDSKVAELIIDHLEESDSSVAATMWIALAKLNVSEWNPALTPKVESAMKMAAAKLVESAQDDLNSGICYFLMKLEKQHETFVFDKILLELCKADFPTPNISTEGGKMTMTPLGKRSVLRLFKQTTTELDDTEKRQIQGEAMRTAAQNKDLPMIQALQSGSIEVTNRGLRITGKSIKDEDKMIFLIRHSQKTLNGLKVTSANTKHINLHPHKDGAVYKASMAVYKLGETGNHLTIPVEYLECIPNPALVGSHSAAICDIALENKNELRELAKVFITMQIKCAKMHVPFLQTVYKNQKTQHKDAYLFVMRGIMLEPQFDTFLQRTTELSTKLATRFPRKPKQSTKNIVTIYDHARSIKSRFEKFMETLSRRTGSLYLKSKLKNEERVLEKTGLRPDIECRWEVDEVADIVRGALETPDINPMLTILELLIACDLNEGKESIFDGRVLLGNDYEQIVIVRVKDRMHAPTSGGWADTLVNFYFANGDPNKHIMEIQLVHTQMMKVRKEMGAHGAYNEFRTALEFLEATGNAFLIDRMEERGVSISKLVVPKAASAAALQKRILSLEAKVNSPESKAGHAEALKELETRVNEQQAMIENLQKALRDQQRIIEKLQKPKQYTQWEEAYLEI